MVPEKKMVVDRILEWPDFHKAWLVASVAAVLETCYFGWIFIARHYMDTADLYLDAEFSLIFQWAHAGGFLLWTLMTLLGFPVRRRRRLRQPYVYAVMTLFVATFLPIAWMFGVFSFPAAVLLAASMMLAIILFESDYVLKLCVFTLVAYFIMGQVTLAGHLSYAPLFIRLPVSRDGLWVDNVASDFAASLGFLVILFDLAHKLISRWRERENEIRRLSITDELTGVANRREILSFLRESLARQRRNGLPLTVILADLDHFKMINDSHGHDAGDQVLRLSAQALQAALRSTDRVGRYGGEEFLIVLPDTDEGTAMQVVERCRKQLACLAVTARSGKAIEISGSFGFAGLAGDTSQEDMLETLLARADEALYRAKHRGRDCAVAWQPDAAASGQ